MAPSSAPAPHLVDAYLRGIPPRPRAALQRLRRTIRAAAPGAEELISYRLPAFRFHGMLVWYGAFEDHLSFFVGSTRVRRRFSAELKSFESGKGTLHFTPELPLPDALVTRLVKARVAENAARRAK
jgi:uncharacterized protein YdhG (YjbR/CyaY superfamily)